MSIVKQYHKDTDTTYVYESESYYDPEKKQSRSRRRVIGKIDKETGEIIPTGRRGPRKKRDACNDDPSSGTDRPGEGFLNAKVEEQEKQIKLLTSRIDMLEKENRSLREKSNEAMHLRKENQRLAGIIARIRELTG